MFLGKGIPRDIERLRWTPTYIEETAADYFESLDPDVPLAAFKKLLSLHS